MPNLIIESINNKFFINGVIADEVMFMETIAPLTYAFLVEKTFNFETKYWKLVFDPSRTQELPNFADPYDVV